jgi:NADPH2:quinone reductase
VRAVQIVRLDGPDAVELHDVPEPVRGPDQVLVDVSDVALNFTDVLACRGHLQHTPALPFTLGSELAGTVRTAPRDAAVAPGDRVVVKIDPERRLGDGACAEVVAVAASSVLPLPANIGFDRGACLPMNYLTAHFALVVRQRLREGEWVLVHGAAGGLGTALVQLARAVGAHAVAAVSTAAKAGPARAAGADHVVLADNFLQATRAICPDGVDCVVDPVGGERFGDSLRCLAPLGRLLVLGFAGGEIPTVRVNRLLLRNVEVVGVGWGSYAYARPGYIAEQWQELLPLITARRLDPIIDCRLPLERASEGLTRIAAREVTGKVVLGLV